MRGAGSEPPRNADKPTAVFLTQLIVQLLGWPIARPSHLVTPKRPLVGHAEGTTSGVFAGAGYCLSVGGDCAGVFAEAPTLTA